MSTFIRRVSTSELVTLILSAILLYYLTTAIYRLFLSPIAHIPGPPIAKLTYWYEFYYDVVCRGSYTFELPKLHKKYGPIIRINPHEVHISDPDFYDSIYTGSTKKRNKWSWFTDSFGIPDSTFSTVEHDKHRVRRAALNPFFSKSKVRSLQPQIEEVIAKLLARFREFRQTGEPMTVSLAFAAVTNDIAMLYAFGRNEDRIRARDFDPSFHDASVAGSSMSHFLKQFPWVLRIMQGLPDSVAVKLDPNMGSYVKMQGVRSSLDFPKRVIVLNVQDIRKQIALIQADPQRTESSSEDAHATIFHQILNSDLPPGEKSTARLWQDGQVTVLAGTITTAAALSWALFHIIDQPEVLRQLKLELHGVMTDKKATPPFTVLEQLPYLTACIKEALRLSNGVVHRLNRISPDLPVVFEDKAKQKQYVIPAGTPMSMTGFLIHMDPTIYENPSAFNPQRWLDNPRLDRFLVPFSRGTRQCLGMWLGYAELYLVLAAIFRRYGSSEVKFEGDEGFIELYETDRRDVEVVSDGVIPLVYQGSRGIRIVVRKA